MSASRNSVAAASSGGSSPVELPIARRKSKRPLSARSSKSTFDESDKERRSDKEERTGKLSSAMRTTAADEADEHDKHNTDGDLVMRAPARQRNKTRKNVVDDSPASTTDSVQVISATIKDALPESPLNEAAPPPTSSFDEGFNSMAASPPPMRRPIELMEDDDYDAGIQSETAQHSARRVIEQQPKPPSPSSQAQPPAAFSESTTTTLSEQAPSSRLTASQNDAAPTRPRVSLANTPSSRHQALMSERYAGAQVSSSVPSSLRPGVQEDVRMRSYPGSPATGAKELPRERPAADSRSPLVRPPTAIMDGENLSLEEVDKFLSLIEKHNLDATDEDDMARSVTELYQEWLEWCTIRGVVSTKSKPALVGEFVRIHQGAYGPARQRRAIEIVQGSRMTFTPGTESSENLSGALRVAAARVDELPGHPPARRGRPLQQLGPAEHANSTPYPPFRPAGVPPGPHSVAKPVQQQVPKAAWESDAAYEHRLATQARAAALQIPPAAANVRNRGQRSPPHGGPSNSATRSPSSGAPPIFAHEAEWRRDNISTVPASAPPMQRQQPRQPARVDVSNAPDRHLKPASPSSTQKRPPSAPAAAAPGAGSGSGKSNPQIFDLMRAHLRDDILGEARTMFVLDSDLQERNRNLQAANRSLRMRVEQLEKQSDNAAQWITHLSRTQDELMTAIQALSTPAPASVPLPVSRRSAPTPRPGGIAPAEGDYMVADEYARSPQARQYAPAAASHYRHHASMSNGAPAAAPPRAIAPQEYELERNAEEHRRATTSAARAAAYAEHVNEAAFAARQQAANHVQLPPATTYDERVAKRQRNNY